MNGGKEDAFIATRLLTYSCRTTERKHSSYVICQAEDRLA